MRRLLFFIIPLCAPFALYALYSWYLKNIKKEDTPLIITTQKSSFMIMIGIVLCILSFIGLRFATLNQNAKNKTHHYIAPYVKDGKIIDGHFQ